MMPNIPSSPGVSLFGSFNKQPPMLLTAAVSLPITTLSQPTQRLPLTHLFFVFYFPQVLGSVACFHSFNALNTPGRITFPSAARPLPQPGRPGLAKSGSSGAHLEGLQIWFCRGEAPAFLSLPSEEHYMTSCLLSRASKSQIYNSYGLPSAENFEQTQPCWAFPLQF